MKLMLFLFLVPILTTATVSVARRTKETTALAFEHFVMSDFKVALFRLDVGLQQSNPAFYATLQAPLTDAEIQALEKKYDIQIPAELKDLYRWKNGQRIDDKNRSLLGHKIFLPLEEALLNRDELNDLTASAQAEDQFKIKNWWRMNWIPIFENGGGNYLCYDTEGTFTGKPNQIVGYYHRKTYRRAVSPNLTTFLETIMTGHTHIHHPGYPRRFNLA